MQQKAVATVSAAKNVQTNGSRRLRLLESIRRYAELLPEERLRKLEVSAQQAPLADTDLVREIGEEGVLLVAFGAAATQDPEIVRDAPHGYESEVSGLVARLQSVAPNLLRDPRVCELAETFGSLRSSQLDEFKPYDDLEGVRAVVTFLAGDDGSLVPALRTEVSFSNRETIGPLSLRLPDAVFLISALSGSLNGAIQTSLRVNESGLVDEEELDGLNVMLERARSELGQAISALSASQQVAKQSSAK